MTPGVPVILHVFQAMVISNRTTAYTVCNFEMEILNLFNCSVLTKNTPSVFLHPSLYLSAVHPLLPGASIPPKTSGANSPQSHRASLFYGVRFQSMGKLQAPKARSCDCPSRLGRNKLPAGFGAEPQKP